MRGAWSCVSREKYDYRGQTTAKVEGNTEIVGQLAAMMVVFDPRFEILPGTRGPDTPEDLNNFEYGAFDVRGE